VIVTGAARGIGKNIAAGFIRAGATVVIADIDATAGHAAAEELGGGSGQVSYVDADLSADDGPERMIEQVTSQFGKLDVLVNNARSRPDGRRDMWSEDRDSWDDTFAVTLRGSFFVAQAALNHWKSSPTPGAAIVNLASIAGTLATHESPAYHAAKGAVVQLTRYLSDVAGPLGVRVNAVSPGLVVQDEHRDRFAREDNEEYRTAAILTHPLGRVGASDDIGDAVMFLSSSRAGFVTGQILVVDGGASIQEQWTFLYRSIQELK
jgi:NAD(P)-dependent dehydrogenase (short-subunit alcohol dehydrogenase family)